MSIKKPDAEESDGSDTSEAGGDLRGAGEAGFADDLHAEGTEVLGDSPDDILVLLPEGADIPIVETEAVDDPGEFETATNTEIVDRTSTVPIEDVPLKDVNPLSADSQIAAETAPPTENLEELASDMDDEFLAPESPQAAAPVRRPPADRGPGKAVPQFYPSAEQGGDRRRPRWRAPLAVAALLALAVTGYLTFPQWRPYVESYLPGVVSSSGHAKPAPAPPPASTGSAVVASKTASPGATDGGGDAKAVDMVRASKEAFREKFLLSIELGYVGEVAE